MPIPLQTLTIREKTMAVREEAMAVGEQTLTITLEEMAYFWPKITQK